MKFNRIMRQKTEPWQAISLAVITTLIAELFFGTTPVSRAFILLPQLLFYGSASILLRETARRLNLSWIAIVLLGICFAFIEEGLTLQSFFNPHFLGSDLTTGRIFGVNTVWAIRSAGYHSFWSICTSLLLTELIFIKSADRPWVGKAGLWIAAIVFVALCILLNFQFRKLSKFNGTLPDYLGTAIILIILLLLAFNLPKRSEVRNTNQSKPNFWIVLFCSFLIGASWLFGMLMQYAIPDAAALLNLGLGFMSVLAAIVSLRYWTGSKNWNRLSICGLVTGMILAELLMGYFMTKNNPVDHVGHLIISVIAIFLLLRLKYHLQNRGLYKNSEESREVNVIGE